MHLMRTMHMHSIYMDESCYDTLRSNVLKHFRVDELVYKAMAKRCRKGMSSFHVPRGKRWADEVRRREARTGHAWNRILKLDREMAQEMLCDTVQGPAPLSNPKS